MMVSPFGHALVCDDRITSTEAISAPPGAVRRLVSVVSVKLVILSPIAVEIHDFQNS
jgi:hypothetical protein